MRLAILVEVADDAIIPGKEAGAIAQYVLDGRPGLDPSGRAWVEKKA